MRKDVLVSKRPMGAAAPVLTGEGQLWLSAIRDTFSRWVVAWENFARTDADLVLTEGFCGRTFTTRAGGNLVLFEYIDGFYHPCR